MESPAARTILRLEYALHCVVTCKDGGVCVQASPQSRKNGSHDFMDVLKTPMN